MRQRVSCIVLRDEALTSSAAFSVCHVFASWMSLARACHRTSKWECETAGVACHLREQPWRFSVTINLLFILVWKLRWRNQLAHTAIPRMEQFSYVGLRLQTGYAFPAGSFTANSVASRARQELCLTWGTPRQSTRSGHVRKDVPFWLSGPTAIPDATGVFFRGWFLA